VDLAFWRDVSIVFLSIQTFILLLVPLVAFYFAVRGLNFLHIRLPRVMYKAQDISKQVRMKTEAASQRVADPVVRAQRERTKAEATLQSLIPSGKRTGPKSGGRSVAGRASSTAATSTTASSASGESEREL
jgi:hypothetical protein